MKRLLLSLVFLIYYSTIFAQTVSTYSFSQSSGTYSEITGGTSYASNSTTTIDAEVYGNLPIGFTFKYNGTDYSSFGICADGWICMGTSTPTVSTTPLSTGSTNNVISAFSRDLFGRQFVTASTTSGSPTVVMTAGSLLGVSIADPMGGTGIGTGALVSAISSPNVTASVNCTSTGTGRNIRFFNGVIRYETLGTAPNRKLVVQWKKFSRYATTAPSDYFNFQIVLNETSNTIQFIYDVPYVNTSGTHQVGLRGASSSDYNNRTTTTDWSSTTSGSSNSASCSVSNTIYPASGLTFTWTPPSPCTGTPNPGNTISSVNPACSGVSFLLSLQNSTSGSGVTYQWQSSPDNLTYTDISGATASTYSATQTVSTWYRCNVTCSGNTGTSNPLQVSINTASVPYSETFTTTTTPTCWTITGWTIGSTRGVTGNPANNIYKNIYGTGSSGTSFSSIELGPVGAGMKLTFDYKVSNYASPYNPPAAGSGNYIVAVSTNGGQSYTDLETVPNNAVAGYQAKTIDLAAYVGQSIKIKFTGNWVSGDWDMGFDNLKVEVPPSCLAPTNLLATGITISSANIGWTAGGSETAWEYVYGVSPVAAPSGSGTPTSNNPTAISGLSANTTYQFYVRADCGSGNFSTWSGPYSFYTGYCVPTGSTVYYLNNVVTTGGVTNISNATGASSGGYGNYSATISCSNFVGTSTSISLSSSASDDYYYCWIDWNNDLDFGDAGETIFATTSYSAGYTGTINIPSGTMVGNYRMRVANSYSGSITSCGPASSGEYEDYTFTVTNPPSCPAPGSLSVTNLTSVSADLGWTAGSTETAWEYVYGVSPLAAPSGSGTPTTSNPTSISGLTAQTAYQFYVRANCGSEFSTWSGPYSFTTLPANDECTGALNVTVNSDNTCTVFTSGSTLGATQSSVGCSGTADDDVWFKFRASYPTHLIDILNVVALSGTSTDMMHQVYSGTCGNLTSLVCSDPNSSTVTGLTIGQTYYVRVYSYYSTSRNSFDICVKLPLCSTPTGLGATNQTPNGATLNWTENGGATSWDLYIVTSGSPAPDGSTTPTIDNTSTKPFVWTGGTSNTPYDWYVRADCGASGGSGQSAWSTVGTFTTSSDDAVDWCNLQWPGSGAIEVGGTYDVYAQAYEPGVTPGAGAGAGITAWIGYSTSNTDPSTWTNWVAATYNIEVGNNDEYKGTLGSGLAIGTYYYASRFKLNAGPYKYGGFSAGGGGFWDGTTYVSGVLTVNPKVGDMLCNAISLTVDAAPATYTNTGCTGETGEPEGNCWGGTGTMESIWFSFVAPSTGSVKVSTDFVTPLTDTHIAMYSVGNCNNMTTLTPLGCDEDSGITGTNGWNSIMSVNSLTPGNTYYVQVDGYSTSDGQFQIQITKQCPATMTVLPASATSTSSTGSCVDGNGWTHYLDNSNNLLLSLKLGSSGAVISGVTVDPDGGTDAVYVLNDADGFPQVGGSTGAAFMKRKWNVNAPTQPSSDVTVRHYYTIDEFNAVNSQITGNGGLALSSHNQLNFYKVLNGMDPFNIGPGGIAIGDIALIINGVTAGINTWVAGTATGGYFAEYLVSGFSGGGGGGASNGKLLPLDLVSFSGIADKDVNILNWKTVNEVNTEKFIVERSIDGNKWEYVADVNASGNSKAERSYTATDEKPYSLSYYRLKMMDRDGRFSYSKNISIERKDNTFRLYSVSPNPNNGNFAVTFNSIGSGKTNLVVVNSLGMKVYSKSVDTKAGTNNEFLGIDNLTDGIYTLILEQNGQIVTQRIAINK